jgi:hypothetical protein
MVRGDLMYTMMSYAGPLVDFFTMCMILDL